MAGDRLTLSIVDIAELPRLAESVELFCAEHALGTHCTFVLNLALEELVSNALFYGFDAGAAQPIAIVIARDGDAVTMEISDRGRPFDPSRAPPPDLDSPLAERRVGGFGIYLVKKMMDRFEYAYRDGCNHVRLTKRIEPAAGP